MSHHGMEYEQKVAATYIQENDLVIDSGFNGFGNDTRNYLHLRASNSTEKQRWVKGLKDAQT